MAEQSPPIYQYEVSETSTKSVQPQVTVYSNELDTAVGQALDRNKTCRELALQGYNLADIFVCGEAR